MEIETYVTTPEVHGNGTYYFTDCGNKMFGIRGAKAYHGCFCPGCLSKGKQVILYMRGTEEANNYWKGKFGE